MNESLAEHIGFLTGGGEMGVLMRATDWSATAVGPLDHWPPSLRTSVSICLNSRFPIVLWWGPELVLLYNDVYRQLIGNKHPSALGRRGRDVFPEVWPIIGPMLNGVLLEGDATWSENQLLPVDRNGYLEECYFTFSYSPIRDESGSIGGVYCAVTETTSSVIDARRLRLLSELGSRLKNQPTTGAVYERAGQRLADNQPDFPFVKLYAIGGPEQNQANRLGAPDPVFPATINLTTIEATEWPVAEVVRTGKPLRVDDLLRIVGDADRFGLLPGGIWNQPVHQALLVPVMTAGQARPDAVLLLGLNPHLLFDEAYGQFCQLLADQIGTEVGNVRTLETERQRNQALLELNQAKTQFFSNVSHEFRTPLTLMLGPVDELLGETDDPLNATQREQAGAIQRNALRLLKLVNTLLDFSQIEAGRLQPNLEWVDLGELTTDLASSFRSTIEKAGMQLVVNCALFRRPMIADREMWEKIVLNLLSNAFKFTHTGEIRVTLTQTNDEAVLTVADTGIGIAPDALPRIFDRFHRATAHATSVGATSVGATSVGGRTSEGSGIGLALVNELVELHGGTITAEGELGRGSVFTVRLPTALPAKLTAPANGSVSASSPTRRDQFLAEASSFATATEPLPVTATMPGVDTPNGVSKLRVLLADDNADMRAYVSRLLAPHYAVEVVADGQAALEAIRRQQPDLLISDIMMPRLDGIGLLQTLKADTTTARLPVMLLSTRAGEEATIVGYDAGADDYLVKPFSANELLVRVRAQLKLAQVRQEADRKLRGLLQQAPVAIAILEGSDFVYTQANDCYLALVDRPNAADLVGKPVLDAHPELRGQGIESLLLNVMQTGEPYLAKEASYQLIRSGQSVLTYFNFVYQPLREPDGRVTGVVVVASEVTEQVLARQKIEEREQELQNFFEQAPVGFAIVGREPDFRFRIANAVYAELVDRPLDDILGKSLSEVLPEIKGQGFEKLLTQVLTTGVPFIAREALIGLTRKGVFESLYLDFMYYPVREPGGDITGVMGLIVNVTQQVIARQQIEVSRRQLQNLFEQAPVAIAILRGGDFVVEQVNSDMSTIWNRTTEQLLGRPIFEVLTEAAGQGFEELLIGVLQTGVAFVGTELPVTLLRNGKAQPVRVNLIYKPLREMDGQVTGIMVVASDVTELVLARQLVEEGNRQFRRLTDLVPQILWTAQPDGYLDYYNQPWYDYTGFEEGYGDQSWIPILHPDDVQMCVDTWYHSVQTGKPYQIEYRFLDRHNPGTYRWFMGRAMPMRDETGAITKWFGTCTDINDQKIQSGYLEQVVNERTELLRQSNANLERSNFDLMQFASVASHDLKEPLRKIQTFCNLLTETLADRLDKREHEHFERIIRAAARMQALVDDVLQLSKLAKANPHYEPVDLNEVIARIQDDLEITIREKGATFRVGPLPTVEAVPGQMHQLFQNLISNAIKFSGGRPPVVTIEVAPDTPERQEDLNQPKTDYVTLSVRDNGIGFEEQYQEKIFGMFQRLHGQERYNGTGIGLTICRRIVENLHGSITAEGRPGEGTTFRIALPLRQRAISEE
ncbi:MAG: PAS domain-containing protein [Cytophagaceae bacterium]|nr:PAS domain-containing protein [Cytophagaceae bacterium]